MFRCLPGSGYRRKRGREPAGVDAALLDAAQLKEILKEFPTHPPTHCNFGNHRLRWSKT
jgi:hypothetical protein